MRITLPALLQLTLANISCIGMESTPAQVRQPHPLSYLATRAMSPTHAYSHAERFLKSPLLDNTTYGPLIKSVLFQEHQSHLAAILKSQVPLSLQIKRFEQYPQNLYPLTTRGLYVRTKKNDVYVEGDEPLYQGLAQLIPDPFAKNATPCFVQVYSNPHSTKYFDDDDEFSDGKYSRDFCIWDKQSGDCVNNGNTVRAKIIAAYPQIGMHDPKLLDLLLYGISTTDSIAWCRLIFNGNNDMQEAVCTFPIEGNETPSVHFDTALVQMSHSGKFGIIYQGNRIYLTATDNSLDKTVLLPNQHFRVISISPCDDYVLCGQGNGYAAFVANLQSKMSYPLTLEGRHVYLGSGILNPLSADGSLIAILHRENDQNRTIYILNVLTNQTICKSPPIDAGDNHTIYKLLFTPDAKQLLALKVVTDAAHHIFKVWDIETQKFIDEQIIEGDCDNGDMIFCNNGDYLLLPNGHLFLQPQGLVEKLSPRELLGLLLLEHEKTNNLPRTQAMIDYLKQNPFPKIQELVQRRYGI